jgi:hypothetical protein
MSETQFFFQATQTSVCLGQQFAKKVDEQDSDKKIRLRALLHSAVAYFLHCLIRLWHDGAVPESQQWPKSASSPIPDFCCYHFSSTGALVDQMLGQQSVG